MVPVPELSTAWVTLAATTRGMEGDIRRAMQRAEGSAKLNPKVNTAGLSAQASKAGKEFGDKFSSSAKNAMKALSVAVVGAGVVDQFKQIMSVGMDWQKNMNTLQAVTGATADQLNAAGTAARALGNDISLPATSANDAASAMTELAKGGFSVQQSMDAAKGSLQLAAAAQIGAADAATIQSQALQAFGLNASDAGKIADTLANAANASSAEITDVAQAMAQAGTVAKQFGLSAEDTAAAIALLANNGIKGSDAGTLLKSSLLALTDQGKPAQGAIKELGLTVYDAQGRFVGLHDLFGQLGKASATMTPEMYQAATATLFGSDAMRLAGVAAKDGSTSYDQMRVSIDRQGAAADVAAAKTKGLPGAWERVKNAMESLQLKAFDVLQGPVSRVLDGMSKGLASLQDKAVATGPKLAAAWKQLSTNPVILSTLKDTVGAFKSLASSAAALWPSLVQVGTSLAKASAALGVSAWKIFVTSLQAAAGVLNAIAPVLATIAGLMTGHQGVVVAAAGAWLLFRTIPALMGRITGSVTPVTGAMTNLGRTITGVSGPLVPMRTRLAAIAGDFRNIGTAAQANGQHLSAWSRLMTSVSNNSTMVRSMGNAFIGASSNVRGFTSALAVGAQSAISGVRTAASGLVGALGGPFSVALIAATAGIGLIASASSEAKRRTRDLAEAQGVLTARTREMYELLSRSGGSVNDSVISKATEQVDVLQGRLDTLRRGASIGDWLSTIVRPDLDHPLQKFNDVAAKQGAAENVERIKKAMSDLGVTAQSLGVLVSGSAAAWDEFDKNARAAGDGGEQLLREMQPLRQSFLDNTAAAKALTPGFTGIRDAIKTIADTASTATDRTNAFKTALDTLAGVQPDVQQATDNYNTTIRQVATATAEAADNSKGMGAALIGANGSVNTATENGHALYEALNNIKSSTVEVAGAGGDLKSALSQNDVQLKSLADKFGLTKSQVDAMAASMGYVPKRLETLMELKGADDTTQQLGAVQELLSTVPPGKSIQVDAVTQQAEDALKSVGVKVDHIDVNGHKQVVITAPNGTVLSDLDAIINKLATLPRNIVITASATPGPGQGLGETGASGQTPGERQRQRLGRAGGGSVFGSGSATSDSIPAMLSNGEHVWTADEVQKVGGQGAMYRLRAMVRRFAGGGGIKTAQIPWPPQPIGPTGKDRGGVPSLAPGRNGNQIALPDWSTPGQAFGPPPPEWWTKPVNPDDILFPEFMPPGQRDQWLDKWGNKRKQWKTLGFSGGGAVTADVLKQFASGVTGGSYIKGGPPGLTGTDCSGAQAALANFITGGSGRFSTGDEASALLSRGFMQGDPPPGVSAYWIGWKNGGPGGGHTAGTIVDPNGGDVNVEMGGASGGGAFGAGAAGASAFPNRAWIQIAGGEDPDAANSFSGRSAAVQSATASVTSAKGSVTSAQASLDSANQALDSATAKGESADKIGVLTKKRDAAQTKLDAATQRQTAAETRLADVKEKAADGADKSSGFDGNALGQSIFGGILQSIGLDGSVFSNPLEWPNVKSAMAVANFGGSLLQGVMSDGQDPSTSSGGGGFGIPGLDGLSSLLKPIGPQALTPAAPGTPASGQGLGPAPGPVVNYHLSGVDPKAGFQQADAHANQTYRRSGLPAVHPQ